ncbi:MAG: phytoene/squalene synthase family protein [Planctomycetota bacterium]
MNQELEASYRWCEQVCRSSKSSFFTSFRLLTPTRRRAMHALYAFARISDDLSDDHAADTAREQLAAWSQDLESQIAATAANVPLAGAVPTLTQFAQLWPALQDASEKFGIPKDRLREIVRGVSMDLDENEIESWEDLTEYCYHVASAVGLACTHIWSSGKQISQAAAIDCGVAFQLTNILRDVHEDAAMGRIYLPSQLLQEFEMDRTSWLAGAPQGNWTGLVQSVSGRAFDLYRRGWETHDCLSVDGQKMFSLMWRSYHALLEAVVRNHQNIWNPKRIALRRSQKLGLAAQHFIPPLYRRLTPP